MIFVVLLLLVFMLIMLAIKSGFLVGELIGNKKLGIQRRKKIASKDSKWFIVYCSSDKAVYRSSLGNFVIFVRDSQAIRVSMVITLEEVEFFALIDCENLLTPEKVGELMAKAGNKYPYKAVQYAYEEYVGMYFGEDNLNELGDLEQRKTLAQMDNLPEWLFEKLADDKDDTVKDILRQKGLLEVELDSQVPKVATQVYLEL